MVEMQDTLKRVKARYDGQLGKLLAASGAFIQALKFKLTEK
jgi:hypothetical protein